MNDPDLSRVRLSEALSILLLVLCIAEFLRESWPVHPQLDDAYISYRYARNLAEGNGLVYNVGEYVEGFTNLLWTLLVAGGMTLGFEANVVGHALGLFCGAMILLCTYLYGRTGLPGSRVYIAGLTPWIVLATSPFAFWATSGMETHLFAATTTAAFVAQARERFGFATLFATLATLTRPDGALVAAILFGFQILLFRKDRRWSWTYPISYLLVLSLLTAFRLAYYGSPVPNTFFAKVGGIPMKQGVSYLESFLRNGSYLLLPAAGISVFLHR